MPWITEDGETREAEPEECWEPDGMPISVWCPAGCDDGTDDRGEPCDTCDGEGSVVV